MNRDRKWRKGKGNTVDQILKRKREREYKTMTRGKQWNKIWTRRQNIYKNIEQRVR